MTSSTIGTSRWSCPRSIVSLMSVSTRPSCVTHALHPVPALSMARTSIRELHPVRETFVDRDAARSHGFQRLSVFDEDAQRIIGAVADILIILVGGCVAGEHLSHIADDEV